MSADRTPTFLDEEAREVLAQHPDWRLAGEELVRDFHFRDFQDALRFAERVAEAAVDHFRRPDLCISEHNRVQLRIANPHHAGISLGEARLAEKVDQAIGAEGGQAPA